MREHRRHESGIRSAVRGADRPRSYSSNSRGGRCWSLRAGAARIGVEFAGAPERRRGCPPLRTTRNEGHPSGCGIRRRSALPYPSPPNSRARSPRFRNDAELIRPVAQSWTCWFCQSCYSGCSYEQLDTIGRLPLGFERPTKGLPLILHKVGRLRLIKPADCACEKSNTRGLPPAERDNLTAHRRVRRDGACSSQSKHLAIKQVERLPQEFSRVDRVRGRSVSADPVRPPTRRSDRCLPRGLRPRMASRLI
jgi:hypothetical protein